MSHCPGVWLEDYVTDQFMCVDVGGEHGTGIRRLYKGQTILTAEQFAEVIAIVEPHREAVENLLCEYDEEEHGSWRDWGGSAFAYIDASPEFEQAEKLIASWKTPKTKGLGS